MKNIARYIGKLALLGFFVTLTIFSTTKEVRAIAMASVTYLEIWDVGNNKYDYAYYVKNQSNSGESLYDFFLDMDGSGATLSNISDPADWEHWTDNSTYIEWDSLDPSADITPGYSLAFLFSSDIQLGDLYYETFFDDASIVEGTSNAVPEPTIMFLIGFGLASLIAFRRKAKIA